MAYLIITFLLTNPTQSGVAEEFKSIESCWVAKVRYEYEYEKLVKDGIFELRCETEI